MGKKPLVGMIGMVWAGLTLSGCMHSNTNDNKGLYKPTPTMSQASNSTPKNNTNNAVVDNNTSTATPTRNNVGTPMTPGPDSGRPVMSSNTGSNPQGSGMPGTPLPGSGTAGPGDMSGPGPSITPNPQRLSGLGSDTAAPSATPALNQTMRPSLDQSNTRPSAQIKTTDYPVPGETTRTPMAADDSARPMYSVPSMPPPPPPPPGQALPSLSSPSTRATPTVPDMPSGPTPTQTTDNLPPGGPTPVPAPGTK
jgi:hypothetical protein